MGRVIEASEKPEWSHGSVVSSHSSPSDSISSGYVDTDSGYYGISSFSGRPSLSGTSSNNYWTVTSTAFNYSLQNVDYYYVYVSHTHNDYYTYNISPDKSSIIRASTPSFTANTWVSYRIVLQGGQIYFYVNGDLAGSGAFEMPETDYFYVSSSGTVLLDELRVFSIGSSAPTTYNPATAPYDTNLVYVLPENPVAGNVYIRTSVPASHIRVGGIRPSVPENGFVYIPLDGNYKGAGCQQYDGSNWQEVDGYIYDSDGWHNVIGFQFWTVGQAQDVNETKEDDPVPTDPPAPTETPTPTDNPGSGSGSGSSGGSGDGETDGFFSKLGELLGSLFGNGLKLFGAALTKVLDTLISLVDAIGDKLAQLVETVLGWFEEIPKLFTGFLDFLVLLFPYLPPEIMLLFTFGLAAVVFIGIIKAIRR